MKLAQIDAFHRQKQQFGAGSSWGRKVAQPSVGVDHPVAGDDQRDRVGSHRISDGAHVAEFAVGDRLSRPGPLEPFVNSFLKWCGRRQVQRDLRIVKRLAVEESDCFFDEPFNEGRGRWRCGVCLLAEFARADPSFGPIQAHDAERRVEGQLTCHTWKAFCAGLRG